VDRRIAERAASQHGVITLDQLATCGLPKAAAYKRARAGRLHVVFPGVFTVGHPLLTTDARRMAAVLSLGYGAVLSHLSAARAWGLLDFDDHRWNVAVPHTTGGITGAPDVRPRRTRRLLEQDRDVLRGIPITSVARTLLDVAGERRGRLTQRAVHQAEVEELLDVQAVLECIERNPGRRGTRGLRAALGVSVPEPTNSRFAARFARLCDRHGLPSPRLSVHIDIGDRLAECDAVFEHARVIVELDGEKYHRTRQRFHSDRRRDTALAARGWLVLRLTWHRVTREAPAVAEELRAILALRSTV
jgi:very-short-patch-repair endonuclease